MDESGQDEIGAGFRRLFTVEEANELLESITPTLKELKLDKEQFDQLRRTLEAMTPAMRGNGHGALAVEYEQRIDNLVTRMSTGIRSLAEQGIEVKDLNQGLIDFPHLREGHVVYLCWRLGEDRVRFWHEIEAGFAGRQDVEDEHP
jgi:hypothetical protein